MKIRTVSEENIGTQIEMVTYDARVDGDQGRIFRGTITRVMSSKNAGPYTIGARYVIKGDDGTEIIAAPGSNRPWNTILLRRTSP